MSWLENRRYDFFMKSLYEKTCSASLTCIRSIVDDHSVTLAAGSPRATWAAPGAAHVSWTGQCSGHGWALGRASRRGTVRAWVDHASGAQGALAAGDWVVA